MDIQEFDEPRTHLIIKDLLHKEDQDMIWDEIKKNESNFDTVEYKDKGKLKKILVFNVTGTYPKMQDSVIRHMFWSTFVYNPEFQDKLSKMESPVYDFLRFTKDDCTKISAYKDGSYSEHTDSTNFGLLTVLYMMCEEPKKFTGGDFVLKWNGKEKVIPFENNKIIIFSRTTPHYVTEIKLDSNNFLDRRFTLQFFTMLIPEK